MLSLTQGSMQVTVTLVWLCYLQIFLVKFSIFSFWDLVMVVHFDWWFETVASNICSLSVANRNISYCYPLGPASAKRTTAHILWFPDRLWLPLPCLQGHTIYSSPSCASKVSCPFQFSINYFHFVINLSPLPRLLITLIIHTYIHIYYNNSKTTI